MSLNIFENEICFHDSLTIQLFAVVPAQPSLPSGGSTAFAREQRSSPPRRLNARRGGCGAAPSTHLRRGRPRQPFEKPSARLPAVGVAAQRVPSPGRTVCPESLAQGLAKS